MKPVTKRGNAGEILLETVRHVPQKAIESLDALLKKGRCSLRRYVIEGMVQILQITVVKSCHRTHPTYTHPLRELVHVGCV